MRRFFILLQVLAGPFIGVLAALFVAGGATMPLGLAVAAFFVRPLMGIEERAAKQARGQQT